MGKIRKIIAAALVFTIFFPSQAFSFPQLRAKNSPRVLEDLRRELSAAGPARAEVRRTEDMPLEEILARIRKDPVHRIQNLAVAKKPITDLLEKLLSEEKDRQVNGEVAALYLAALNDVGIAPSGPGYGRPPLFALVPRPGVEGEEPSSIIGARPYSSYDQVGVGTEIPNIIPPDAVQGFNPILVKLIKDYFQGVKEGKITPAAPAEQLEGRVSLEEQANRAIRELNQIFAEIKERLVTRERLTKVEEIIRSMGEADRGRGNPVLLTPEILRTVRERVEKEDAGQAGERGVTGVTESDLINNIFRAVEIISAFQSFLTPGPSFSLSEITPAPLPEGVSPQKEVSGAQLFSASLRIEKKGERGVSFLAPLRALLVTLPAVAGETRPQSFLLAVTPEASPAPILFQVPEGVSFPTGGKTGEEIVRQIYSPRGTGAEAFKIQQVNFPLPLEIGEILSAPETPPQLIEIPESAMLALINLRVSEVLGLFEELNVSPGVETARLLVSLGITTLRGLINFIRTQPSAFTQIPAQDRLILAGALLGRIQSAQQVPAELGVSKGEEAELKQTLGEIEIKARIEVRDETKKVQEKARKVAGNLQKIPTETFVTDFLPALSDEQTKLLDAVSNVVKALQSKEVTREQVEAAEILLEKLNQAFSYQKAVGRQVFINEEEIRQIAGTFKATTVTAEFLTSLFAPRGITQEAVRGETVQVQVSVSGRDIVIEIPPTEVELFGFLASQLKSEGVQSIGEVSAIRITTGRSEVRLAQTPTLPKEVKQGISSVIAQALNFFQTEEGRSGMRQIADAQGIVSVHTALLVDPELLIRFGKEDRSYLLLALAIREYFGNSTTVAVPTGDNPIVSALLDEINESLYQQGKEPFLVTKTLERAVNLLTTEFKHDSKDIRGIVSANSKSSIAEAILREIKDKKKIITESELKNLFSQSPFLADLATQLQNYFAIAQAA